MLSVRGQQCSVHFRPTNGCSYESDKVFETEDVLTWGGLEPQLRIHAECSNYLSYQGQTFVAVSCFLILALGYKFFLVKLTFGMLTVRGQQRSFSTHERIFLWNCQSFWDRKCLDMRGTRTPNLRIHAEWAIRARYLLSRVFEYWLRWYRYFIHSHSLRTDK